MKKGLITETERLFIRKFTPGDAPFILQLLNTPGWIRYIGDRKIRNEEDALKYLDNGPLKMYRTKKFGLWKVETKAERKTIGMCGLLTREHLPFPDLGFAFLPEHSGHGYAYESAVGCINFAKAKGVSELCAITLPSNKNSIRLLGKVGMQFEKKIIVPPDAEVLDLFVMK